jgi:HEAT repeat protein
MGLFAPPNIAKLEARWKIPRLIKALGYRGDSAVRARAAHALGRLGAVEAVDRLAELCRTGDGDSGPAAVEAVAQIGEATADAAVRSKVIEALIDALRASETGLPDPPRRDEDRDASNRSWARYHSQKQIWARVWNEGLHRRSLAAAALGKFRDARAVDPLRRIGDTRAIPGLEAALADEDDEVRDSARMALSVLVATRDQ